MKTSAFQLNFLVGLFFCSISVWAETPASHGSPSSSTQRRPVESQTQPSAQTYSNGRYLKNDFQYLNSQGAYVSALAFFKADEPGTLLSKEGNTVRYKAGDVLFKTVKGEWQIARLQPAPPSAEEGELSEVERLVVELTNQERIKRGLPPLEVSENLLTLSRHKSANMARLRNLDHGVSPRPQGGENIAWNQRTAQEVVRSWMNSSGHRANILSRRYSKIGVGVANGNGPYWTQMFQ